jgi:hypothetical protein
MRQGPRGVETDCDWFLASVGKEMGKENGLVSQVELWYSVL